MKKTATRINLFDVGKQREREREKMKVGEKNLEKTLFKSLNAPLL